MSDENESQTAQSVNSRRSFLQKGALGSGVAALGIGGMGLSGGREGTDTETSDGDADEGAKALMFNDEFRPGSQFRVRSPVVEQNPDVRGVEQSAVFSEYNTRIVEYLNTDQDVSFFPAEDAEVEQGGVYVIRNEFELSDPEGQLVTTDLDRVNEEDLDDRLLDGN